MLRLIHRVFVDEQGGEVLEYALIIGLVVATVLLAVSSVGTKVFALWTSLNEAL